MKIYTSVGLCLTLLLILLGCVTHTRTPPDEDQRALPEISTEYTEHKSLTYAYRDGNKLDGDLYLPQGEGPFPVVLVIHGGAWSSGSRSTMTSLAKKLASHGIAAFNISYSFAPQYRFPEPLEDCKQAIRWIQHNADTYKIDPTQVGAWGYSAGAHLAALLGVSEDLNGSLKAVVGGSGPYNLTLAPDDPAVTEFLGTTMRENEQIFHQASPVLMVNASTTPMFLYHGTWDRRVYVQHSLEMRYALDKYKVRNELYLVKGLGHITMYLFDGYAVDQGIEFLRHRFTL